MMLYVCVNDLCMNVGMCALEVKGQSLPSVFTFHYVGVRVFLLFTASLYTPAVLTHKSPGHFFSLFPILM